MSWNSSNTVRGEPGVLKNQNRSWVHKAVGWILGVPTLFGLLCSKTIGSGYFTYNAMHCFSLEFLFGK